MCRMEVKSFSTSPRFLTCDDERPHGVASASKAMAWRGLIRLPHRRARAARSDAGAAVLLMFAIVTALLAR